MNRPDTLLLLSGGIDSAYCLWQRAEAGLATRTHHVVLRDAEGRATVESRATRQILDWIRRHAPGAVIEHTESAVDFRDLWVPLNHHLWAYWVGAILAAPNGRDHRHVIIPRHADAFHDSPADGPAAQASDAAYLGHVQLMAPGRVPTLQYPIRHLTKAQIVAAMPPGLLARCWWCRRPDNLGRTCRTCYTCRLVDPALPDGFRTDYLNEWTEAHMGANKLTRVEVRVDGRIRYANDVEDVRLEHDKGVLAVVAFEPGAELDEQPSGDGNLAVAAATGTPAAGLEPLVSETDDQPAETTPVIERVHTGAEYAKTTRRGKKHAKAEERDDAGSAAGDPAPQTSPAQRLDTETGE